MNHTNPASLGESTSRRNVYEIVTEQIIRQLEQGVAPWHKPWRTEAPCNLVSGNGLNGEPFRTILSIAGGFISSVSLFPLKEVNGCRDRISFYQQFREELRACPEAERDRIDQVVWEAVKKVALG